MAEKGSVFGQGASKDLNSWIEKCRVASLSKRNLKSTLNGDKFNNQNSSSYREARDKITDIIQNSRTISIQMLYDKMDQSLLTNPNTKNLVTDLWKDGDVNIRSDVNPTTGIETNFILSFIKRKPKVKVEVKKEYKRQQGMSSNIEDVLDNNFFASGRKLGFDRTEHKKEEFSLNLKKHPEKSNKTPVNKPVQDVRNIVQEPIKEKVVPKPIETVIRVPDPIAPRILNAKQIDIFAVPEVKEKPKPIEVIDIEEVQAAPIRPKPKPKMNHFENKDPDVFMKYSDTELAQLICYVETAIKNKVNKRKSKQYKNIVKSAKTYYSIKKEPIGIGKKITSSILGLTLIFSVFIPVILKDKVFKEAKKLIEQRIEVESMAKVRVYFENQYKDVFSSYNAF